LQLGRNAGHQASSQECVKKTGPERIEAGQDIAGVDAPTGMVDYGTYPTSVGISRSGSNQTWSHFLIS
jgi:hypothetical protein